jgi:hypothetical protein
MALPNLDSFVKQVHDLLAIAAQNYHHNSISAGLLEIAGTKNPHIKSVY